MTTYISNITVAFAPLDQVHFFPSTIPRFSITDRENASRGSRKYEIDQQQPQGGELCLGVRNERRGTDSWIERPGAVALVLPGM